MKRYIMKKYVILVIVFATVGLLGCSSSEKCKNDSDCPKDSKCIMEKCYPNSFTPDPQIVDPNTGCSKDEECGSCKRCDDGICRPIEGCDVGIVVLDASRDVVKADISDVEDIVDSGFDAEIDADVVGTDLEEIMDGDVVVDIEPSVDIIEDVGTDVTDLSNCDASGTLVVTSRSPAGEVARGTTLTINGQGFDKECGTLSVTFTGDDKPANVIDVSSSNIKVIVPGFAQNGPVTINSFGQTKSLSGFKIQRRLFFTDFGNLEFPGKQFFVLSFPNFLNYKAGRFESEGKFPDQILLDPYNLMVLVVTRSEPENGYVISAYNFATLEFIKKVSNTTQNAIVTAAMMDYEKNRIYLTAKNGRLYVHEMGSLTLLNGISVGVELYGIDIDKDNNRIFLSGRYDTALPPPSPPPLDYKGAVFVRDRDTFSPLGNEVVFFGNERSLAVDVKYHRDTNRIFTVDYFEGNLYAFDANKLTGELSPISLGSNSGPMKMAFGKDSKKLYIVCNNSSAGPQDATASIKGFDISSLTEISGSPFDTKLVTSTTTDNSKNLVNIVYDDLDGYLIAVSNADNRVAVIVESTFTFLVNPSSPENTKTSSTSGNLGISVEDW